MEPVFVIKFFRQEWRAYNFDTKLRINSLNKINDGEAGGRGRAEVKLEKILVLVILRAEGESVRRVK